MTKGIVSQRVTNLMTIYQKSRGPLQSHLQNKGRDPSGGPIAPSRPRAPRHLSPPGHCTWIIYKRLSRGGWRLTCPLSTWARLPRSSTFHPAPHPLSFDHRLFSLLVLTLPPSSPPTLSSPFSLTSHPAVPATEGCHAGLTRCICLSRPLLLHRRERRESRENRESREPFWHMREHPGHVPREKIPAEISSR